MGVAYSASFARLQCLAATHLSSPEVSNGLSWPKPLCTCNAMVTSQAQHSTNEGVLRSNSACSMLMSDDLRLPRRGIEPWPFGFPRHRLYLFETKNNLNMENKHGGLLDLLLLADHFFLQLSDLLRLPKTNMKNIQNR